MKLLKFIIPIIIVIALICSGAVYVNDYYCADSVAVEALESDGSVAVIQESFGWYFDGPSNENALIFYPGGKVEETAYAPLLHSIAAEGVDVFLVRMPARLAFFGIDKAKDIIAGFNYSRWYIGGHSLGGVAASCAAAKADFDGLILLASYSTKDLPDDLDTLLVYGSLDGVLNFSNYKKNKSCLPAGYTEYVIDGGNHSGFGSYGKQKNDGEAKITPAEQTKQTAEIILNFIGQN